MSWALTGFRLRWGGAGSSLGWASFAASALLGCATPAAQNVWSMPTPLSSEDATYVGGERGYPFGNTGRGVAGADSGPAPREQLEQGDLPEAGSGELERYGFWRQDEPSALHEAERLGRGLVVSFFADWCEGCERLEHTTFMDPQVRSALVGGYIPLRIDVSEESQEGRRLLRRYRVDHLPAVLILDERGRELDRIEEFVPESAMLERLVGRRAAER